MVDDFKQGFREFDPAEWQLPEAADFSKVDACKGWDGCTPGVHQVLA
jgi:hypothetical protein